MLQETHGLKWWPEKIPDILVKSANKTRNKEFKSGVNLRSERMLDYLTCGELSEVIKFNWSGCFDAIFSDLDAVIRIMNDLNGLRGPIAHCCVLPADEVGRFELRIKDLMRQL